MCGIVAILSKSQAGFFQTDKTLFYQMLISDMFRGVDSTGCYAVNKHGNLKWVKDASASPFFLNKKETISFMDKFIQDYHIMVGHNRKATMGSVTAENAHPFVEGNICLVHNGTLREHKKLADKVVDSNAICHHIAEHGYKSLFKNIDGAYALIWYNAAEKTLYFARNSERPLHMVETDTKIYLASEEKMLDWLLDRNGITKYKIQSVPTDKIFKFNLDTKKLECETKPKKEHVSNQSSNDWAQNPLGHQHHQKNRKWKERNRQSNLSLLPSSVGTESSQGQEASIESYESGSTIKCKVVDFHITEVNTKLCLETLDGLQTPCVCYLSHTKFSQKEVDALINAEAVYGIIQNITSKKGSITVYLRELRHKEYWTARKGVIVDPEELDNVGGCCWQCSASLSTQEEVRYADITINHNGDITYVLCESCADAIEHRHYNGMY